MAVWWGVEGTARVTRAEAAELAGTFTVTADPDVYVEGTATVDRTTLAAWSSQFQRTATRVLMGEEAEDVGRIQGSVEVSVDSASVIPTASFVLTDPRCAYSAADSLATGGIPVTVRCRVATPLAVADTVVFRGLTEAAPNTGAYVPTATIQCAGEGADFLEQKGCLNLPAFSNVTRLAVLKAFAESVGIDPARIIGGEGSATVYLPLDLSGLSTLDLALRFAELEDWYVRLVDGNLELLAGRDVVGSEARSVFDFTDSNALPASETPPNRPITRYTLSAVGVPVEILSGGTEETTPTIETTRDEAGTIVVETRTLTTTVNGALTRQRIEEWRTAGIPGETPSAAAFRLWQLTELETTHQTVLVDGVALRTARIEEQRTTVHGWYSPPCRSADGFVWSDTTRHLDAAATWRVISTAVTTYTYDDAPSCILLTTTTRKGGWYSPVVASGEVYDGGKERSDTAYQWISEADTQPFERVDEVNAQDFTATMQSISTSSFESKWRVPPGSSGVAEEWGVASGSRSLWSTVPGSGLVMVATYVLSEDGTSVEKSEPYGPTLPVLPRAAADTPQYRTEPLVLTAAAAGSRYTLSPKAEPIWGAETMADLITVARRRFRNEHSPRVTIPHPALPLLQLYHVVTVTDPARTCAAVRGYVDGYRLGLNASTTGRLAQETVVVLPLAAYDPGSEVVTT